MMRILVALATATLVGGCSSIPPAPSDWTAWQARRNASIGGTNGWTTLVGRHWLGEGANTVGAASTNHVIIEAEGVPPALGTFTRRGQHVRFVAATDVDVRVENQRIRDLEIKSDAEGAPTRLMIGGVSIVLIQRGERLGLRVKDPASPARREFKGIRWFPYDPAWRIEGRYVPFLVPRKLQVPDVTGATQEFDSPGELIFVTQGAEHRLEVVEEPGEAELFIIFRDQTAGKSTYGSGRFLQVAKPGDSGVVTLDFNRAYTPPCGYTAFATCPLPPPQNWLNLEIRAGELKPAGHP